jgi:hypothetical protein
MKTIISNPASQVLEVVKRTLYTVQVIALGLFIPFLFVFGITCHIPAEKAASETHISAPAQVTSGDYIRSEARIFSTDQES